MMRSLLLAAVLAGLTCSSAGAGITESGGTGILDVDTPETLPGGRLALSLAPRYGYLSTADSRLHTVVGNLGATLGLPGGFEAAAVLPLHAYFRTDTGSGAGALFEEDFSFRRRDLELKLRKAFPLGGERLRFALEAIGSAPIGSDRVEEIYAPGDSLQPFTSDTWNYGLMALTSLDFTGPTGNAPLRLHLNGGYYLVRNETRYAYRTAFRYPLPLPAPEKSRDNDLLLLGAGLEFPLGRLSAFGELSTEQLVHQRDLVKFAENPITVSGGLRFLFPGSIGLTSGISVNLSHDDGSTPFDPGDVYPDWELRVSLSLGDVLQSRRQRLIQKDRKEVAAEALAAADTVTAPAETVATAAAPERAAAAAPEDTLVTAAPAEAVATVVGADTLAPVAADTAAAVAPADTARITVRRPTLPASEPPPAAAWLLDTDGDGIPDRNDACPLLAEDPDGWKDTDGCPDRDNDQDGILDIDDPCPNTAEDYRGPNPNDGCPTAQETPADTAAWDRLRQDLTLTLERGLTEVLRATPAPVVRVDPGSSDDGSSARSVSRLADEQVALTRELRDLVEALRRIQPAAPPAATGPAGSVPVADRDRDGISDAYDRCPEVPEDVDGWQDEDGCPDLDNDGDGIRDLVDRCPNVPETWNGFQDDDGCPDTVPVGAPEPPPAPSALPSVRDTVTASAATGGVSSPEPVPAVDVFFDSGSAGLTPLARGKLDNLASALLLRPEGTLRISGYSDASGDPRANERLSAARAGAVRDCLTEAGVDRHRLALVVRGAADPIGDNRTPQGRARNRRVTVTFLPGGNEGRR